MTLVEPNVVRSRSLEHCHVGCTGIDGTGVFRVGMCTVLIPLRLLALFLHCLRSESPDRLLAVASFLIKTLPFSVKSLHSSKGTTVECVRSSLL